MAKIPESVIEEVLSKADIESVVGKYVSFTKRTGSNLFGLCPFHSEKSPSFSVAVNKGIYRCFGCNKGGNAISFIMEIEKLSYPEAIRFLGAQYGVDVPTVSSGETDDSSRNLKKRVSELLTEAARFFYASFIGKEGKIARDYASKRELSDATLKSFGIGYAPDGWDNLYRHLVSKGYTEEEMKVSGLFTVSQKTGKLIDLFRGRIIFPIFDSFGKIVAFGGRCLGDEKPKYVNSPDSLVYKKQQHLYGLNFAKKANSNQLIIVEGYMDVIAMHQAGITNAVAALGTAFTDSQLRLAARFAEEIVFFFDSDNAGQKAALRAIEMMQGYLKKMTGLKIRIKIAVVPDGKDPDEYIKNNGAQSFANVVKNARDVDDYLFDRAYNDNCNEEGILDTYRFQEDIIKYGSIIHDELKREKMSTSASSYIGVNYQSLLNRINDVRNSNIDNQSIVEKRSIEREESKEISQRISENESSDDSYEDSDVEVAQPVTNKYADIAYLQELQLFVYAVRMKEKLATDVDIEDVLRTSDFAGDNMKEIVEFFLKNFNSESGVSEAVLIDKLSTMVLNGERAEQVYFKISDSIPETNNTKVTRDKYLAVLYDIRVKQLERIEKALVKKLASLPPEERISVKQRLNKLNSYRNHIRAKGAGL